MTSRIEQKLAELGLTLPVAAAPAANYVPWTLSGRIVRVSGQLPMQDGKVSTVGRLGEGVSIEAAQEAAKHCALNLLAQLKAACGGDLDKAARCLKLGGFVSATAEFSEHHKVINGASDLMVQAMGEGGRHARFAVGVPSLPFAAAVEIEATFELA